MEIILIIWIIISLKLFWDRHELREDIDFRRNHAQGLCDRNEELKTENKDLRKEISYLKQMAGELKED